MHRRLIAALSLPLLLAACSNDRAAAPTPTTPTVLNSAHPDAVPGQYIVVLREDAGLSAQAGPLLQSLGLDPQGAAIQRVYSRVLNGFSARLSAANVQRLLTDPRVAYIEQDVKVYATDTQYSAPWGLDRIDQRLLPLNGAYTYNHTGAGVTAYVLDTGIRTTHSQFGGRATWGANFTGDGTDTDCNGHGTHVAGTIGGSTYGVAKTVNLVAVKVLSCDGTGQFSYTISAMDWVAAQGGGRKVVNMSLGPRSRYTSQAVDDAVARLHNANVPAVVAAGNSSDDANYYSPARAPQAITVGSATSTDARSSFSNYGTALDLFAPGSSIISAWHTGDSATNTISGTSMASPHVAGAVALLLQENPGLSSAQVASEVIARATLNRLSGIGAGSPNRLLYSVTNAAPPVNTAPTANFTASTSGLNVTFTNTSADAENNVTAYAWNFGDGTTSAAVNPTKSYAAAGTYTVTLTVTDAGGLSSTVSRAVTVTASANQAPTASFTLSRYDAEYAVNATSTSSDPDGTIVAYLWDMGDGTTYTDSSVYHNYPGAGYYTIRLTVTDNQGLSTTTTRNVRFYEWCGPIPRIPKPGALPPQCP